MKNKSTLRQIVMLLIFIVLLLIVINPALLPFISAEKAAAIRATLADTFGFFKSEAGGFSLPTLFSCLAIIFGICALSQLLRLILEHTVRRSRSKTVATLMLSVIKYASVIVAVLWCLSRMGVNVAGIFAGVGILTLVIGFGAERLVEDIITGIFIIFEGQYNIGDVIVLDDFRGVVRKIGVRTTTIEDAGGNLKIVNNSDIRNVQNRSRNLSYAVCDIGISYGVRIEDVEKVALANLDGIYERNRALFSEKPRYCGVQTLGESSVVLRFVVCCDENNIFSAQRALNREIKIMFDDNGIEVPFNQIVVHSAK
ncbi:MAG: mechanosensitive ion channel family protein [Oscillospiraceae bacterium]|nr:mechanosensitive ion channel family protein [Oscillospiraceae bacterium]